MSLLTVDPGVAGLGWAIFHDYKLSSAGLIERTLDDGLRPLVRELRRRAAPVGFGRVLIEVPQVYVGRRQKGDPNDLIWVAVIAGAAAAATLPACEIEFIRPHVWKGTVPKDIHQKRIDAALDGWERDVVEKSTSLESKRHNVVDAVGIGLWKIGRIK